MGRPKKTVNQESIESGNESTSLTDDLAVMLAENLNKEFKDYKVAYFFDETPPTTVTDWISTGNSVLDLAISNRKNGGIPVGKITEIMGLEASGKSLLAAHLLATTQKMGGLAVYIDTESAVNDEFLAAIGVDKKKLLYAQLELIEDVFTAIENIITNVRTASKDRLVTIVVDSVAATSTKDEIEGNFDKDGWATQKAIIISKAMRKITNLIARQKIALVFTNQLREKLGAMYGNKYTTSGGKALGFHASVRLTLKAVGGIKVGEDVVGIKCKAQVTKNRMGPPLRTAEYDMFFASGIDNYGGWLTTLKNRDIVQGEGRTYRMKGINGEELKFQSKDWASMLEDNPEFKDYVYNLMAEELILKYRTTPIDSSDIIVTEDDIDA